MKKANEKLKQLINSMACTYVSDFFACELVCEVHM